MIASAVSRVAVVAFTLFGIGCSSTSGSSTSGGDGGAANNSGAVSCDLAPASEIATDLGLMNVQPPSSANLGTVTECTYDTSTGSILIRYETDDSMAGFMEGQQGFTSNGVATTPVTGVGDAAYSSGSGGFNTIVVLRNTTEVEISGKADLDKLKTLATHIVASF